MAFITIAGENKIAYQQGNSLLLNITHFVLANIAGLGAEPANRIEGLPASGDIVHTQSVTRKGYVNANQVVYSLAMDSTIGDFDFNWVGIKDADNVLIACSHIPTQQKRATAGAVPGNNVTRNFLLAFSGIAATTAISVPAETWQIDFTTRLLQIDDRERLSNFDIYGQAAFFGDGFKVSLQSGSTYQMAAGIGYVGGIRCEQLSAATINVTGLPKAIWMDASLQGDINGVSAVFSFSATAATLTDYTDGSGFRHYVAKIADISAGGVITDIRSNRVPFSHIISIANSTTFTVPNGVFFLEVETWGAGGGGCAGIGGAGGGGGYACGIFPVIPGETYTVTIGAAGYATVYPTPAGNGGTTSFGSLISATGGQILCSKATNFIIFYSAMMDSGMA